MNVPGINTLRNLASKAGMVKPVTTTVCYPPVAGCLIQVENYISSDGNWFPDSATQRNFLADYYANARAGIVGLRELESIASLNTADINKFLKERGFDIQLSPTGNAGVAVASVFKLLLEWTKPGRVTDIKNGQYPAIEIKQGEYGLLASPLAKEPILMMRTKSGDCVYMTVSTEFFDQHRLFRHVSVLNDNLANNRAPGESVDHKYSQAVFPMISYDAFEDISWLVGMRTQSKHGTGYIIEQALQQTKFRMNEIGAIVESAVAMQVRMMYAPEAPRPKFVIDKPFILWISRPGMTHPLFIAQFTEEHWKKPEKL